jgi:hypothetical protein
MIDWKGKAEKWLVGKTVKSVRYMTDEEAEELMWDSRPLAIFFDDGSFVFASMDDEGNNGGAFFTSDVEFPCIPVLGIGD